MRLTECPCEARASGCTGGLSQPASTGVSVHVERRYGVGKKRFLSFTQAKCGQTPAEAAETRRKPLFLPAAPADRASLRPLPV